MAGNVSDVTLVRGNEQIRAKNAQLDRILEEAFDFNYLVVADKSISAEVLRKVAMYAAILLSIHFTIINPI